MRSLPCIQKVRKALILVAFGAALGLVCGRASAQVVTMTWANMAGGYFTNALNWNPQTVPTTTNDTAVFTNIVGAEPYTVFFNQQVTNKDFKVNIGKVIFDLCGGTNYIWGRYGVGQASSSVGSSNVGSAHNPTLTFSHILCIINEL